jgi:hypothetical protein
MKNSLLALIIAAGASGCAGPAGYGFGKTAESYRICAAAPATPGCENGFAPESDAHYAARMGAIGAYLSRPAPQPMPLMPFQQPRFGPQIWIPSRY